MQSKFFYSFFLILCVTFGLLLVSNVVITQREDKHEILYTARKSLNQTKSFLEFKTASSKEIVNTLAYDRSLQEILNTDASAYQKDVGLWSIDRDHLKQIVYSLQTNPDIKDIKLYMKKGPATLFETDLLFNLNHASDLTAFQRHNFETPSIQWFLDEDFSESNSSGDNIVVVKNIMNENNLDENIGVIRVDFKSNTFSDVLDETNISRSSFAMLLNPRNIVCTSDLQSRNVSKSMLSEVPSYVRRLNLSDKSYPYWNSSAVIHGQKFILGIDKIDLTDWQLVLVIPQKDVLATVSHDRMQLITIFLIILPLSLLVTYLISCTYTRRISALASQMHNISPETFSKEITPSSKDEIGILTQNFNYMLTKISMLMDEKYRLGEEVKNSELAALQSQINPHFLYNTLDQLYWLGVRNKTPEISNLVMSLSRFYKLSLSKGKSIVPLRNELDLIQAYVYIQNYRYDNMITLKAEIDSRYLDTELPKITLQPIVENAILHGICEKEEPGTITITSSELPGVLLLHISDNGIGMDASTIEGLPLQPQTADSSHGYGLYNIDHRLKLLYGAAYGLSVTSTPGIGTTVTVKIPYHEESPL